MIRTSLALAAALASLAALSASAQSQVGGQNSQNASGARGWDMPPSQNAPPERTRQTSCLINKVTKKRECHTRAGWRKIAAKLEEQQAAPSAKP